MESDRSNVTVEGTVPLYSHETEQYIKLSKQRICVDYQVSQDPYIRGKIADRGRAYTTSDIDYTIKVRYGTTCKSSLCIVSNFGGHLQVEAKNLLPFTTYYYQFNICDTDKKSPIGRTKTIPSENDHTASIGLAVFSCSNYPNGYFNAYGNAARKDNVDYVVHLGDYIYEGVQGSFGNDSRASNPPRVLFSLHDYRTRLGQYRTDLDLLLSHQKFAWIPVWDDHEVANNGYRDGFSAMSNTEKSFLASGGVSVDQRKMNAVRAYFEWMPIRQVSMDDNLRIWRNFRMGKLLDLIMLDTRNYDRSITSLTGNEDYIYEISNDAGRSLMGSQQENWFYRQLSESADRGAAWRIIGNQIIFSRMNDSTLFTSVDNPFNLDQWDGYMANKNRTFQHLYDNQIGNNIMLAGDSHANWVSDLVWLDEQKYDAATGQGAIGVEFAGTAVSSSGAGKSVTGANDQSIPVIRDNAELQWNELYYRGYFELQINYDRVQASFFGKYFLQTVLLCKGITESHTPRLSDRCDPKSVRAQPR